MRQVYVNGQIVPESAAKISVFDRGFLFADGVYEVFAILGGRLIDYDGHVRRLKRLLGELEMRAPLADHQLLGAIGSLVELNALDEGLVYLPVARGAADRDFAYPSEDVSSSLVMFTQTKSPLASPLANRHQDRHPPRFALAAARYLNGAAALLFHGQEGNQAARRRRRLACRGRAGNGGHLQQRLYRDARSLPFHLERHNACSDPRSGQQGGRALGEAIFRPGSACRFGGFRHLGGGFVLPVVAVVGQAISSGAVAPVAARLQKI